MPSCILFYDKIKWMDLQYEYLLWQKGDSISFYGAEKEKGRLLFSEKREALPYPREELLLFLKECAKTQTSPRVIGELMEDWFAEG